MNNFLIGCVGKPSAGKSSFLNAATDANAKVGNYPFTTIEPNNGVTFYQSPCPCKKYGKENQCLPRYGKCIDGIRFIPVKMLDVAGLVPGASEGKGLGNKFLDDLRTAHVLLHIVDASGQTNEKGEVTKGYDPINDIQWLLDEIHSWIFNNLWRKWPNIVRRHTATKSSAAVTLQLQFSGYGTNLSIVQRSLDRIGVKEPSEMESWDKEFIEKVVKSFMEERFPTIVVLNKIDQPDADSNILKICQKYSPESIVCASALAECFLRKMTKEKYIRYTEGSEFFDTFEDDVSNGMKESSLRQADEKLMARLEKVRDLVLFRYGSTGVQSAIKKAVDTKRLIAVYPVKNLTHFSSDNEKHRGAFRDCMLVYPGTTVREFCRMLSPEMEKHFLYAEGVNGQRLGEDEEITWENHIIKFTTAAIDSTPTEKKEKESKVKKNPAKNKEEEG